MSTKRKLPTNLALPVVRQSAKPTSAVRIDESKAAISTGNLLHPHADGPAETIEISSDSSSDYGDALDDEEMPSGDEDEESKQVDAESDARASSQKIVAPKTARIQGDDTEMASPNEEEHEDADASDGEAPTFGDLLRGSTTVDVPASLGAQPSNSLSLTGAQPNQVVPASLSSLGTVLNQALRTDDTELLETCLVINDVDVIQKTIDRLDSALAGVLLRKLTARMHRRPGRAFGLMRWMQWTLVAHGGALTSQPDIVKDLSGLNRVLDERARGLPSLLALKSKLDMQDSQLKMHKFYQRASRVGSNPADDTEDSDEDIAEEHVVYVENEENDPSNRVNGIRQALEAEDDFPLANGVDDDSEDEEEDEEDEEAAADLFGEEDSLDEDEVDHDDVEESGEEDDTDADVPPAKLQKTKKAFSKRK